MKYVIANWKMNMTINEVQEWCNVFGKKNKLIKENLEIIIAPSFVHLPFIAEVARYNNFALAAQDVSVFEHGAHTGEVGAFQVKELCNYSIVGHSERLEGWEIVQTKRDNCWRTGIIPIVCFTKPDDCRLAYRPDGILAWEDPTNISRNGVFFEKNPKDIEEGVKSIRAKLPEDATLIYGGSVNQDNIRTLVKIKELDGVLVGSASLDPEHFIKIIEAYSLF